MPTDTALRPATNDAPMELDRSTGRDGADGEPGWRSSWERHIELVVRSLQARLDGAVAPNRIRAEGEAEFAAFSEARIREYVPVLVETRVRARLAGAPERMTDQYDPPPKSDQT